MVIIRLLSKLLSMYADILTSGLTHLQGIITEKLRNITINNGDSETMSLCLEKKNDYIYIYNMISHQSNFQCNQPSQQVVTFIKENES